MKGLGRSILLSVVLGAVIYLALTIYGQSARVGQALSDFRWTYVPALLGLASLNYATRFVKWHYYLHLLDIQPPLARSFSIFLSGLVMTVTPGKMGEVLKSFLLKETDGVPVSETAPVVLAERMSDLVALVVLTFVGLASVGLGIEAPLIGLALVAVGMIIASQRRLSLAAVALLERPAFLRRFAGRARTAYESAYCLLRLRVMGLATLISIPAWFCECLAFYVALRGTGAVLSLLKATSIYGFASVAGALSMLPGGLGIMEGSLAGLLSRSGVARAEAVGATLIIRACTLWFAVLTGAVAIAWVRRLIGKGRE